MPSRIASRRPLAILLMAALAALLCLAVTGCGGKPANLEEYYNNHPDELNAVKAQYADSEYEGISSSKASVSGNTLQLKSNLTQTLTSSQIAEYAPQLDRYLASMDIEMAANIEEMEKATGVDGVIVRMEFYDAAGAFISGRSYTS